MYICKKKVMEIESLTYNEMEKEIEKLLQKKLDIMDICAKEGKTFDEFMEIATPITEQIYLLSQEKRLKQTPTMEYGKEWKGNKYIIEYFSDSCKNGVFADNDGYGYYATENAKSDIIAYPSDFTSGKYRTDFTHIIWFNK